MQKTVRKLPPQVDSEKRVVTLDFIRGVAILGIFLMNIVAFGLPSAAYMNPAWAGMPSQVDVWSWALSDLLAQFKFLSLFALLFGASLQLLLPRGKNWIQARLFWLLLLGFLHGVLLWDGDILFDYGLTGMLVWRLIDTAESSAALLKKAAIFYLIGCLLLLFFGFVTDNNNLTHWQPTSAETMHEIMWKTAGGLPAMENRLTYFFAALISLIVQYGWQLSGLMLLGSVLVRNGWLLGHWPVAHYRQLAWKLIGLGWLIEIPTMVVQWQTGWDYAISAYFLQIPRDISAPVQALGYAALCFGYWQSLEGFKLSNAVCCVGRMALSNYLLQTLLATSYFYSMQNFNHYGRAQLLLFVPVMWSINLLLSVCWLSRYPQGPVEMLWRSVTRLTAYGRSRT
ncbi:MAG: hypothetical protein XXXJIFNMEKO3_01787 [Candidatus Erwinia impunctatus]